LGGHKAKYPCLLTAQHRTADDVKADALLIATELILARYPNCPPPWPAWPRNRVISTGARPSKPSTHQPKEKSQTMFKTIARPDHSECILATPPQHCISLIEARMLKGILLEKLPPGSTVATLGTPAGALGGDDHDEKWLNDNLAGHDRPLVLRIRIRADIGQTRGTDHTSNAAALATA
jgi:hypothetical protein